jgi:hypothetical protein
MYSSVWNWVISAKTAGLARYRRDVSMLPHDVANKSMKDRGVTYVDLEELVDVVIHH